MKTNTVCTVSKDCNHKYLLRFSKEILHTAHVHGHLRLQVGGVDFNLKMARASSKMLHLFWSVMKQLQQKIFFM